MKRRRNFGSCRNFFSIDGWSYHITHKERFISVSSTVGVSKVQLTESASTRRTRTADVRPSSSKRTVVRA